eukprot:Awhi_evm1s1098
MVEGIGVSFKDGSKVRKILSEKRVLCSLYLPQKDTVEGLLWFPISAENAKVGENYVLDKIMQEICNQLNSLQIEFHRKESLTGLVTSRKVFI